MKTNQYYLPALIVAGAILVLSAVLILKPIERASGASLYDSPFISMATTSTSVAVTGSARILATTTNNRGNGTSYTRIYTSICNTSAIPVYINMNSDIPAGIGAVTKVIAAAAGYDACMEIKDVGYNGSITASSTNVAVTLNIQDFTQI